jgi:hypothetical protein
MTTTEISVGDLMTAYVAHVADYPTLADPLSVDVERGRIWAHVPGEDAFVEWAASLPGAELSVPSGSPNVDWAQVNAVSGPWVLVVCDLDPTVVVVDWCRRMAEKVDALRTPWPAVEQPDTGAHALAEPETPEGGE